MKLLQDIGRPLFVPQDHRDRRQLPGAVLDALRPEVLASIEGFLAEPSAESFWRLEERVTPPNALMSVLQAEIAVAALTGALSGFAWRLTAEIIKSRR